MNDNKRIQADKSLNRRIDCDLYAPSPRDCIMERALIYDSTGALTLKRHGMMDFHTREHGCSA